MEFSWDDRIQSDLRYKNDILSTIEDLRMISECELRNKLNEGRRISVYQSLLEHLKGLDTSISNLMNIAHKYDFDPSVPCNGYRSLVKIIQKCCVNILNISKKLSDDRRSFLFGQTNTLKELSAYVSSLGQLRACIYYLDKLVAFRANGSLFPDENMLSKAEMLKAESLMREVEMLNQECFYGRCLAFQVNYEVGFVRILIRLIMLLLFFSVLFLNAATPYVYLLLHGGFQRWISLCAFFAADESCEFHSRWQSIRNGPRIDGTKSKSENNHLMVI